MMGCIKSTDFSGERSLPVGLQRQFPRHPSIPSLSELCWVNVSLVSVHCPFVSVPASAQQ